MVFGGHFSEIIPGASNDAASHNEWGCPLGVEWVFTTASDSHFACKGTRFSGDQPASESFHDDIKPDNDAMQWRLLRPSRHEVLRSRRSWVDSAEVICA